MKIEQYIITQAVLTRENELIPIWDERVKFQDTESYGNMITLKGDHRHQQLVECIFDLETKQLSLGVELKYLSPTFFEKDEIVLYEKSHKWLEELTISRFEFEKFELTIARGKELDLHWKSAFPKEIFDDNKLYCIKNYKPSYILSNGVKVEWEHKLFKKVKT